MFKIPENLKSQYDEIIEKTENLIDENRFSEAKRTLSELPEPLKKSELYHAYSGYACFYLDEFETAVTHFNYVLNIKPNAENILFMKALAHDYLDQTKSAINDYLKVLKINSQAKLVHRNLGLLAENGGDMVLARSYYIKALEVDKTDKVSIRQLKNIS